MEEKNCLVCGQAFTPAKYHPHQYYCCKKCSCIAYKKGISPGFSKPKKKPKPPHDPIPRFLKPGIVPQTEGWNSGIIAVGELPRGGKARLKCDPAKLPKPTITPERTGS